MCDKSVHEVGVQLGRVSGVPQEGGDRLSWMVLWVKEGRDWGEGGESD